MADIKEQDLEWLTSLPDTAWIRVGTNTTNNLITVGNLKSAFKVPEYEERIRTLETKAILVEG